MFRGGSTTKLSLTCGNAVLLDETQRCHSAFLAWRVAPHFPALWGTDSGQGQRLIMACMWAG